MNIEKSKIAIKHRIKGATTNIEKHTKLFLSKKITHARDLLMGLLCSEVIISCKLKSQKDTDEIIEVLGYFKHALPSQSHKCTFSDNPKKGEIYDLDKK